MQFTPSLWFDGTLSSTGRYCMTSSEEDEGAGLGVSTIRLKAPAVSPRCVDMAIASSMCTEAYSSRPTTCGQQNLLALQVVHHVVFLARTLHSCLPPRLLAASLSGNADIPQDRSVAQLAQETAASLAFPV